MALFDIFRKAIEEQKKPTDELLTPQTTSYTPIIQEEEVAPAKKKKSGFVKTLEDIGTTLAAPVASVIGPLWRPAVNKPTLEQIESGELTPAQKLTYPNFGGFGLREQAARRRIQESKSPQIFTTEPQFLMGKDPETGEDTMTYRPGDTYIMSPEGTVTRFDAAGVTGSGGVGGGATAPAAPSTMPDRSSLDQPLTPPVKGAVPVIKQTPGQIAANIPGETVKAVGNRISNELFSEGTKDALRQVLSGLINPVAASVIPSAGAATRQAPQRIDTELPGGYIGTESPPATKAPPVQVAPPAQPLPVVPPSQGIPGLIDRGIRGLNLGSTLENLGATIGSLAQPAGILPSKMIGGTKELLGEAAGKLGEQAVTEDPLQNWAAFVYQALGPGIAEAVPDTLKEALYDISLRSTEGMSLVEELPNAIKTPEGTMKWVDRVWPLLTESAKSAFVTPAKLAEELLGLRKKGPNKDVYEAERAARKSQMVRPFPVPGVGELGPLSQFNPRELPAELAAMEAARREAQKAMLIRQLSTLRKQEPTTTMSEFTRGLSRSGGNTLLDILSQMHSSGMTPAPR